jgi:hypothetical protein
MQHIKLPFIFCKNILFEIFFEMNAEVKGKAKAIPGHPWTALYSPGEPRTALDRPLGFQEFEAPRISRQSVQEGGNVVSPKNRPSLSPHELFLVRISVRV